MKSIAGSGLIALALLAALPGTGYAQGIGPNQAQADAELDRQRAESLAVQRRNEQSAREERAEFAARKKAYEQEERRKEEQQQALAQDRASRQIEQGEPGNRK